MNNMFGFGGFGFSELPQLMQLRGMKAEIEALEAQIPKTDKLQSEINELKASKSRKVTVDATKYDTSHEERVRSEAKDKRDKLKISNCPNRLRLDPDTHKETADNMRRLNFCKLHSIPMGFVYFRRISFWVALVATITLWALYVLPDDGAVNGIHIWALGGVFAFVIWVHQFIKKLFVLPDFDWNVGDERISHSSWQYPKNRKTKILLSLFIGAPLVALSGAAALFINAPGFIILPTAIHAVIVLIASPFAVHSHRDLIRKRRVIYREQLEKINNDEAKLLPEAIKLDQEQKRLYNEAVAKANSAYQARIQAQIDSKQKELEALFDSSSEIIQQVAVKKMYYQGIAANWGLQNADVRYLDCLIRHMQNGCTTIMQAKQSVSVEAQAVMDRMDQQEALNKLNADMKEMNRQQELRNNRILEAQERQHREMLEEEQRKRKEIEKLREDIKRS